MRSWLRPASAITSPSVLSRFSGANATAAGNRASYSLRQTKRRSNGTRARANPSKPGATKAAVRSEEHTSELQSLMRNSYAVFCLKKKEQQPQIEQASLQGVKTN